MSQQLNAGQVQQLVPQNQNVPPEGPVALKITIDFTSIQDWDLDLYQLVTQKRMSIVQGVFIDARESNVPVTVRVGGVAGNHIQNLVAKANSQGYYSVICPNPPLFRFSAATGVVTFFLYNMPVAGHSWDVV